MARDLVRLQPWPPDDDGAAQESEQEWDLPPTRAGQSRRHDPHPIHTPENQAYAQKAEQDAAQAEQRGDDTFKALREEDAGDLRQSRWDRGDLRTWLIIAAMCLGFILFSTFIYFMPQGRHNQADDTVVNGRAPTPTIRVY